ncbi:MAG: alpha/beta fold hydrolase [Gammaproteobacteria bacterium]|nr:alpha/beta fold hydrolase [Gammaproteobacteria bacterium]
MSIVLHRSIYGRTGHTLIVLHGLFGSLDNWKVQCQKLAQNFTVHALDLRNHGQSPHRVEMSYPSMAEDVLQYIKSQQLNQVCLLGHSMGGKVAMELALAQPTIVRKLIVADIAPKPYPPHHNDIFDALQHIDLASLKSRREADEQLKSSIESSEVRGFLAKSLYRQDNKQFNWRFNLPVLIDQYAHLAAAPSHRGTFTGPTLFIKGGTSDYITQGDEKVIRQYFPAAQFKLIQNAGHWLHAEKPEVFTHIVQKFLLD